jgi:uncharacterized protein
MFGIDPLYWMMITPALLFSIFASIYTKVRFSKYSKVGSKSGITGAEAATRLLQKEGGTGVRIEEVNGFLSDHYDPMSRTPRLSPNVYESNSLAAIGVACHEAGHAIQHARHYAPLMMRSVLVPAAQIGSWGSYIVLFLGFIVGSLGLIKVGIALFSAVVAFSIITLPVEWNASARAKRLMVSAGVISYDEAGDAGKVLNAAFMTYLAAALSALMTLLYYLYRAGLLGGRRD